MQRRRSKKKRYIFGVVTLDFIGVTVYFFLKQFFDKI